MTIIINRTTVLACCILWMALVNDGSDADFSTTFIFRTSSTVQRHLVFAILVLIGIVERLSGIANTFIMERDWVPALAEPTNRRDAHTLTRLNATMRRIDLICKLFAPLAISAIIETFSSPISVLFLAVGSILGIVVEPQLANRVWSRSKKLQARKIGQSTASTTSPTNQAVSCWRLHNHLRRFLFAQQKQAQAYFSTTVWVPSLSLTLLHFSALSYAATFVTWLLGSGFSLLVITTARTIGSCVEVSSTFVAPFGIDRLARTKKREIISRNDNDRQSIQGLLGNNIISQEEHITGLARSGLWSVFSQLSCLVRSAQGLILLVLITSQVPVVFAIFSISYPPPPATATDIENTTLNLILRSLPGPSLPTAIVLFTFLSISRLGLWTFDLCVQELDQILVPAGQQAAFAGTETAFASLFELGQWALVAVLSSPDQFVWVAVLSLGAVALSAIMYAGWHLRLRGHLVHWDRMSGLCSGWAKK